MADINLLSQSISGGILTTVIPVGGDTIPNAQVPSLDASQITTGTFAIAQIPTGSSSSTVCIGDDARLADSRPPVPHATTHVGAGSDVLMLTPGDIPVLDASKVASGIFNTAQIPALDTSNIATGVFGISFIPTGATGATVCIGDDARLSDNRTPLVHATTHASAGSDPLTSDITFVPGNSGDWAGDPTTLQAAVDRMASLLNTLNAGPVP